MTPQHTQKDGIVHNFRTAEFLSNNPHASVKLDALADSRGLSVCVDGHHMNGSYAIIPWELIDAKRAERDKAMHGEDCKAWARKLEQEQTELEQRRRNMAQFDNELRERVVRLEGDINTDLSGHDQYLDSLKRNQNADAERITKLENASECHRANILTRYEADEKLGQRIHALELAAQIQQVAYKVEPQPISDREVAEFTRGYDEGSKAALLSRDNAYTERNRLVALLARIYPSGIRKTAIDGWDRCWHNCVFVDTPAGQMSWHYHDQDADLFAGLPPYTKPWDGHTTPEKYQRLWRLTLQSSAAHLGQGLGEEKTRSRLCHCGFVPTDESGRAYVAGGNRQGWHSSTGPCP